MYMLYDACTYVHMIWMNEWFGWIGLDPNIAASESSKDSDWRLRYEETVKKMNLFELMVEGI